MEPSRAMELARPVPTDRTLVGYTCTCSQQSPDGVQVGHHRLQIRRRKAMKEGTSSDLTHTA